MPFGAHASSCFMQRIANFITRILADEGITAIMYLDDIVVVAPTLQVANAHYARVRALLHELGLPEAHDKAQPPSHNVRWLGIDVDSQAMSLSIPQDKVREALTAVQRYIQASSINKRQLQSLIGRLVHVAKCVEPARVFISRLLQALRAFGDRAFIKVTQDMRSDLAWFVEFLVPWNGVSLIPQTAPHKTIQVDACLTGVGATDGTAAYAARIAPDDDPVANVTEIEAANIVIALHTFITDEDAGGHVLVQCDNLPSVQALTSGRAHNPVLAECACAIWMLQARFAFKVSFSHIAGDINIVADALSRAHLTKAYYGLAHEFVQSMNLVVVRPCTHILSYLYPPILSRRGVELAGGESGAEAGTGPSTWNQGSPEDNGGRDDRILLPIPHRPRAHDGNRRLPVDRVPGEQGHITVDNQEQTVTRQGLLEAHRGINEGLRAHTSIKGNRWGGKAKGLCPKEDKRCDPSPHSTSCSPGNPERSQRTHGTYCHPSNVLWGVKAIRGSPTRDKALRPPHPLDSGGRPAGGHSGGHNKGREKSTALRPTEGRYVIPHRRPPDMPHHGSARRTDQNTPSAHDGPTTSISGQSDSHANFTPQGGVGAVNATNRRGSHCIFSAQPEEGFSNLGTLRRLFGP